MNREETIRNIKDNIEKIVPSFKEEWITIKNNESYSCFPSLKDINKYIFSGKVFDAYIKNALHTLLKFEETIKNKTTKTYKASLDCFYAKIKSYDQTLSKIFLMLNSPIQLEPICCTNFNIVVEFNYSKYEKKLLEIIQLSKELITKLNGFVKFNNLYNLDFKFEFDSGKEKNKLSKDEIEAHLDAVISKCESIKSKHYTIGIFDSGQNEYNEIASTLGESMYCLFALVKPEYQRKFSDKKNNHNEIIQHLRNLLTDHYKPIYDALNSNEFLSLANIDTLNDAYDKIVEYVKTSNNSKLNLSNNGEARLNNLIGLQKVKDSIAKIKAYTTKNANSNISFHMAFYGNPGTGKTEVARIIADILYENKVLKTNKLIEANRQTLVGQYVGETAIKTQKVIDSAMGGVLFIDEAYLLAVDDSGIDYGHEAIGTLIDAMEDNAGKFCVILAGYENEMKKMIASNPGFKSRIQFQLKFDNYSRNELYQIAQDFISKKQYSCDLNALERMLDITDLLRKEKDFANARSMRNIVEGVIMCQNIRVKNSPDNKIIFEDVEKYIADNEINLPLKDNSDSKSKVLTGLDQLNELIGLDNIKLTVKKIKAYSVKNCKSSNFNMHMCFTGNPGTGKTEVARIISQILYEAHILKEAKVIETDASGLVSEYTGKTQEKTNELIKSAMGGVLFIDEAYSLKNNNGHNDEAVAALIKAMEDNRGNICIILAGYKKEMDELIATNPGFKSRIQFNIDFPDYSSFELGQIFNKFISKSGYNLSSNLNTLVDKVIDSLVLQKDFSNARTIRNFVDQVILNQNLRTEEEPDNKIINDKDIMQFVRDNNLKIDENKINNTTVIDFQNIIEEHNKLNCDFIDYDYLKEAVISLSSVSGAQGTGFIISSDGYALTCAHCIENDGRAQRARVTIIIPGQGSLDIYNPIKVLKMGTENDIALIKVVKDNFKFKYLAFEKENYSYDALKEFIMAGYPFGGETYTSLSLTDGKIASVNTINTQKGNDRKTVFANMFGKSGNSGSPVLDKTSKKIIGIFWGCITYPNEEINCFTPLEFIYNMFR